MSDALRDAILTVPLGTMPKPGLSSVAGWNRYDTDDEHVLHLFESHEPYRGQSWDLRVPKAAPSEAPSGGLDPERLARLHRSPRCPAKWRCRLALRGQRGSNHQSYSTEEERHHDIEAHYEVYSGTAEEIAAALSPTPGQGDGLDAAWDAAEIAADRYRQGSFRWTRQQHAPMVLRRSDAGRFTAQAEGVRGTGPTPGDALLDLAERLATPAPDREP